MVLVLEKFVLAVQQENLKVHQAVVWQEGQIAAQHMFCEAERQNIYSGTKSVTSAAVGLAVTEGLLSLEQPVAEFFCDELPDYPSENLKSLCLRDLLSMNTGYARGYLMGDPSPDSPSRYELDEKNWVRYALSCPLEYPAGQQFCYQNIGPYLAGVMVQRAAGMSLTDYLVPRLFDPLGIARPEWETCPMGYDFGAGGLVLNVFELLRFGILYLQEGCWQGKQLLPADWVRESTVCRTGNPEEDSGYGYFFWIGKHGSFRVDGKYAQLCIIWKEKNAVISILSNERKHPERIRQLVWETIAPELSGGGRE